MNKALATISLAALAAGAGISHPATILAAPPAAASHESAASYEQMQAMQAQANAALKAGDAQKASALATQLLRQNTDTKLWYYGDIVYDANQILGLAALREGKVAAADQYLLAAGHTPGSPVLDSFGPEMPLAQALYAKGQKQAVQSFLTLVLKFWGTTRPGNEKYQAVDQANAAKIHEWQAQIAQGQTPSLNRFEAPPAPPLLAAGADAPDFAVQDKSGKTIHLSDYKGKTVVLDFWATWCGPCQRSLPHTNTVARQFAGKNVVVLAVNVWDTQSAFDQWLPKHPEYDAVTFAIDTTPAQGQDVASRLYHVSGIPTQYIINPAGKVVKSFVGFGGPSDDLANAITSASAVASLPAAP